MGGFLFHAFVYLCAAVVAVPIAKRLGLGSVLGYLIAGVVIGPLVGLVGTETQDLQHFAEFGVVMMLFLVGLELEPRVLWEMRNRLLGLGGLQVGVTTALVAGIALGLGVRWSVAVAIGLIFSLSSTAIVLQTLNEKGLTKTEGGRASFSVLLFQDIAVIPMLALLPLLAVAEFARHGDPGEGGHGTSMSLVDGISPWAYGPIVLGAVALVIIGGRSFSRPLFRFIAQSRLREIFTAAALLLVIGIALLMTLVGLSPALGTFLAGVVLADSEYRHELESDIEPFKGLLLGLFFITVGAGIDFGILGANLGVVLGLTVGLMTTKALVLFGLTRLFPMPHRDRLLFTLGLAQAGEFGFVLLSFCVQNAVVPSELAKTLSLVVALSMLLTPALFILYDRVIAHRPAQGDERTADEISERGTVIIAGHGRFGQIVNRLLLSNGYRTVVLDHRSELVDGMRKFGVRTFYGDATRPDLLHAAGLHHAEVLVVAIDDRERAVQLVEHVRRERADIHIIARAQDRHHVYALYSAGANDIVRETFDSSVRAGRYAMVALGEHPFRVEKAARVFVDHDRETLAKLARAWNPRISVFDNPEYLAIAKKRNEMMEAAMQGAHTVLHDRTERGWTPPPKNNRPDPDAKSSEVARQEPTGSADVPVADGQ